MGNTLDKRIQNSKNIDFGDIISKSFDLFKITWVDALLHALITFLVLLPFMLIIYIPLLPIYGGMLGGFGESFRATSFMEETSGMVFFMWIGLIFFISFFIQPIILSVIGNFLQVCKNKDLGLDRSSEGYFNLLKNHFGKLFLLSLASMGISILAILLCFLPILYVVVPLQLLLPVLVFNKSLTVTEIIVASFKLGNKYWLLLFGLIIVSSLLSSLGFLLCGIGVIVTSYYQYIVLYFFYKDSVGFDE